MGRGLLSLLICYAPEQAAALILPPPPRAAAVSKTFQADVRSCDFNRDGAHMAHLPRFLLCPISVYIYIYKV